MSTWDLYTPDFYYEFSVTQVQDRPQRGCLESFCWPRAMRFFCVAAELVHAMRGLMSDRRTRGFSLTETMMVVAIMFIMASITFISLQPALKDAKMNAAYDTALSQ